MLEKNKCESLQCSFHVNYAASSCVTSGGMNDPWLRLLYTSLELIRSSRVLAAGSAHNVLSVVTYRSVSSRLKVYPDWRMRAVRLS